MNSFFYALNEHPLEVVGLLIFLPLLGLLIFNHYSIKNNQITTQLQSILKKEEKKDSSKNMDFMDVVSQIFEKKGKEIELKMERANLLIRKEEYLTWLLIGIVGGFFVGFAIFPFGTVWMKIFNFIDFYLLKFTIARTTSGGLLAFMGYFLPEALLKLKIYKRNKTLDDQIEDALLNMADALRSGMVPQEAIKFVGDEMSGPMGEEFSRASEEIKSGKHFAKALADLKDRVNLQDFNMAVSAIEIQTETGGPLEPLLREMVKVINERKLLKKEMDKAIASSKTTGIILLVAPILFLWVFSSLNKEGYEAMLTNPLGIIMIVVAVVSYLIGAAIIFSVIRDVSKAA